METEAGEEAQVDFGTGALVRMADGKVRRPWVFRIVLSYSRKAYSEAVWHQSTESFLTCLENAFRHFGGVPKRLVIDNLKAAVARAGWYDPEIHRRQAAHSLHGAKPRSVDCGCPQMYCINVKNPDPCTTSCYSTLQPVSPAGRPKIRPIARYTSM